MVVGAIPRDPRRPAALTEWRLHRVSVVHAHRGAHPRLRTAGRLRPLETLASPRCCYLPPCSALHLGPKLTGHGLTTKPSAHHRRSTSQPASCTIQIHPPLQSGGILTDRFRRQTLRGRNPRPLAATPVWNLPGACLPHHQTAERDTLLEFSLTFPEARYDPSPRRSR